MRCSVTGKPRRGLADFLSRELKTQVVAPEPKAEVRQSETDRVPSAPVVKAGVEAPKPEPVRHVEPATPTKPEREEEVRKSEAREVRESVSHEVRESRPEKPEDHAHEVRESVSHEVRESSSGGARASKPEKARTAEVTKTQSDRVRSADRDEEEGEEEEPLYLRLTRKEVRFRDDQLGALHAVTRRLSKARRGAKGGRITENTLVRVAVDLLLLHGDELSGNDEATLLESLRKLSRKKG
jgi:hypothetical protein